MLEWTLSMKKALLFEVSVRQMENFHLPSKSFTNISFGVYCSPWHARFILNLYFPTRVLESPTAEYVLSGSEDNIVAYRIVHMPDESSLKQNNNHHHQQQQHQQSIQTATQAINGASVATTTGPTQHLQYIVIDSANGFLQAVPTNQITTVPSTPIKVESNNSSTLSSILSSSSSPSSSISMQPISKARTSIAIAPKMDSHYSPANTYTTNTATNNTNKSHVRPNFFFFFFWLRLNHVLIIYFILLLIGLVWFGFDLFIIITDFTHRSIEFI